MDSRIREIERILAVNPYDFETRKRLTRLQLKAKIGDFVFWRGTARHPASPFAFKTKVAYSIGYDGKDTEITEDAYLLALLDTADLCNLLAFSPDAILKMPSNKLFPLNGKNNISRASYGATFDLLVMDKIERKGRQYRTSPTLAGGGYAFYDKPFYDRQIIEPGDYPEYRDKDEYPYDEYPYHKGTLRFFDAALGELPKVTPYRKWAVGKEFIKTQADTNIPQVGSFPYPWNFDICGFSIIPDRETSLEDFHNLIENSYFRLVIGTMSYLTAPAKLFAAQVSEGNYDGYLRLSSPVGPHYCFPSPIELIPQQNYMVEINIAKQITINKPVSMMCIMWGSVAHEVF